MKYLTSSLKLKRLNPVIIRRVVGGSMQPTLRAGQIVIGLKNIKPKVDQIIVVNHDGRELIKRLQKIKPNQLYITGDNVSQSSDSRKFGWINGDSIVATVIWPIRTSLYPHFIQPLSQEK
jgi:phage repressor protein C with HTH and peptisase S24 domain